VPPHRRQRRLDVALRSSVQLPLPTANKKKISSATVRDDFNDLTAVLHYTRAAHGLGLWESERILIERTFTDRNAPLIEAGCGAGRVTLGLWSLGFRHLTAFDFAEELLVQARALAAERGADLPSHPIRFLQADATQPLSHTLNDIRGAGPNPISNIMHYNSARQDGPASPSTPPHAPPSGPAQENTRPRFAGALFMFNGLMQIPGRDNRRAALRELRAVCTPGAPLLFTTHDRNSSSTERALWRLERVRWERGEQDPRLVEFGDRYFEEAGTGRTFMHLPDRREIRDDLAATDWTHESDCMRSKLARESKAVRDFSDECRFWIARA